MKNNLKINFVTLEIFEKAYKTKIERSRFENGFDEDFEYDNPSILKEYLSYINKCLKKTDKVALYHWNSKKEQVENFKVCFSDISYAKAHYVREHLTDANTLEVYSIDKKILSEYYIDGIRYLVQKNNLKLVMSLDMSMAKDKPNYFEDMNLREENKEVSNSTEYTM